MRIRPARCCQYLALSTDCAVPRCDWHNVLETRTENLMFTKKAIRWRTSKEDHVISYFILAERCRIVRPKGPSESIAVGHYPSRNTTFHVFKINIYLVFFFVQIVNTFFLPDSYRWRRHGRWRGNQMRVWQACLFSCILLALFYINFEISNELLNKNSKLFKTKK